jgi:hypothetical protein
MRLHTTSETISFIRAFENSNADFYEDLSERFPEQQDALTALAAETRKHVVLLERAYYSVISDALEGGYAFDMDPDAYRFNTTLADDVTLAQALTQVKALEETGIAFYTLAAEQSAALMADVPQTMKQIVKKKVRRQDTIAQIAG